MTQSDRDRINNGAKAIHGKKTLQIAFTAGANAEAAHWQPIVAEQKIDINLLIDYLHDILNGGSIESPTIKQLISKHKKP